MRQRLGATLRASVLAALSLLLVAGSCGGGSGGGGKRPVVKIGRSDPSCLALPGAFPPGLVELPGVPGLAALALFGPPALLSVDLEHTPPLVTSPGPVPAIPADSDGDGVEDAEALRALGRPPLRLNPIRIHAAADDLVLVASNGIEEVIFVEPVTGTLRTLTVETPATLAPGDAPLLPPPGTNVPRTAVSTLLCVRPGPGTLDSEGRPVGPSCDPNEPSFETNFTSGVTTAAGHLFVSTSNFIRVGADPELQPGTVLIYELDLAASPPRVRLHPDHPVLLTTVFNPARVTSAVTAGGREIVLVAGTGVIQVGAGSDVPLGPSAIDILDAASLRVVATVPLGVAALSSAGLAVHPSGRVAVGGSFAFRHLFAVDLAPVDAAIVVHTPGDPPIVLDGSDSRLAFDARVFTADDPFAFPGVPDGAPVEDCAGAVFGAAFNGDGSKLFATDFCDGVLAVVGVDLTGLPDDEPVPQGRFELLRTETVTRPNDPARFPDAPTAPGPLLVRRGRPGIDYQGPDVFVLVGLPEGELCGIRVDSF